MDNIVLFRKLEINNEIYYQLCQVGKIDIKKFKNIGTYEERKGHDYFYIETEENVSVALFTLLKDSENEINEIKSKEEYNDVLQMFFNKFKDFDLEEKLMSDKDNDDLEKGYDIKKIIDEIEKVVWFQEEAIENLVKQISINQFIGRNHKSTLEKSNVIIFGSLGIGKSMIVKELIKNLNTPHARIFLTDNLGKNVEKVLMQLAMSLQGDYDNINCGTVFIEDNYADLDDGENNPFGYLEELITTFKSLKKNIDFGDKTIAFDGSKITFVAVIDSYDCTLDSLCEVGVTEDVLQHFHIIAVAHDLTRIEKKKILLKHEDSILNIYKALFLEADINFRIEKGFIDYLLEKAEELESGMDIVYSIIDSVIKLSWLKNSKTVYLTKDKLDKYLLTITPKEKMGFLDTVKEEITKKDNSKEIEGDFRTRVNSITTRIQKSICGQDAQVKRLVYTVLKNNIYANKDMDNPERYIKNILLRGETGVGKTAILTRIAKEIDIPISIADATRYTEAGYVGDSVENMLRDLYLAAGRNLEKAQKGILVIDEIDKKNANKSDGQDVSRAAVLNGLLKIVEGTICSFEIGNGEKKEIVRFDTSRLTVVCSGAFEGIEEIQKKRLNKTSIGFGSEKEKEANKEITDEDYVAYGMVRQFMARLGVIVNLNKLSPKDLKNIMINSDLSELSIQKQAFALDGIELEYQDDFMTELASIAFKLKIGARGIEKALQTVFTNLNIQDIDEKLYSKIIFTKECILDPSKLILIEREESKVLKKI